MPSRPRRAWRSCGRRFQSVAALGAALEAAVTGAAPQIDPGGATLRLSDAAEGAARTAASAQTAAQPHTPQTAAAAPAPAPQPHEAAAPRALSQSSLSAAASEHVHASTPAGISPPAPTTHRILVIAVVVGLIIGAGAVTVGVFLGRSPTRQSPAQGPTKPAAFVLPPADAGAARRTGPKSRVRPRPSTTSAMPTRRLIALP